MITLFEKKYITAASYIFNDKNLEDSHHILERRNFLAILSSWKYVNKFIDEILRLVESLLLVSCATIIEKLQKYPSCSVRSRISPVSILLTRVDLPLRLKPNMLGAQFLQRDTCFGYESLGFLLDKTMIWPVHLPFKTVHDLYARAFTHIVIPTSINNITESTCRRRDRISFVTRI